MARGRLISKSLGSSRKFHRLLAEGVKLGEFCQVLFPLLVANTDDFGRMPGDAFTVKNLVLPSSPRPERDFGAALDVMHRVGIITRYVVNGSEYLAISDFDTHQPNLHKRTASKFPEIPESPGDSEEVPEVPLQSNLTESKGTEPRTALAREADVLFSEFWMAYPKKKSKDAARKAWDKRRPTRELLDAMLAAIAVQADSRDWQKDDGQFIPHPATWLNHARWTDVVTPEMGPRRGASNYQPTAHSDYDSWPEVCRQRHGGECGNYQAHCFRLEREKVAS